MTERGMVIASSLPQTRGSKADAESTMLMEASRFNHLSEPARETSRKPQPSNPGPAHGVKPPACRSALDGPRGETGDVVFHEERVDQCDGNRSQQRPCHELTPVEGVPADQLADDADRDGAHVRA